MHQGGPMLSQQQGPPRYPPNQGQWGQPRPNGPRPGPPGPPQRPQMVKKLFKTFLSFTQLELIVSN